MRARLQLSCFITLGVLLLACRGRETERPDDDLPPPAPQVDPVPEVPPNPIVNVPRPNVSAPAPSVDSRPPKREPMPEVTPDTLVRPAPALDTRPSIPLDSIR